MAAAPSIHATVEQTRDPEWGPLTAAVGTGLCDWFMWMFELRTDDGSRIQVYKHRATRAHLHLGESGEAYVCLAERHEQYVPTSLAAALSRAVRLWSVLEASAEDVRDVHAALSSLKRNQLIDDGSPVAVDQEAARQRQWRAARS